MHTITVVLEDCPHTVFISERCNTIKELRETVFQSLHPGACTPLYDLETEDGTRISTDVDVQRLSAYTTHLKVVNGKIP